MSAPRSRLVVRTHAPGRHAAKVSGLVVLGVALLFGAFEFGRGRAGFDGGAARSERAGLKDQVTALGEEARALRLKIAMYETERAGQVHERTELSKNIGELQAEVARLTSDVAFYRGVVEEKTSGDVVKIQQFRVNNGKAEREFLLKIVLGRPLRPEDTTTGKARIAIEGTGADGQPATLDLAATAGLAGGELPFNFRYVETLEQAVRLPAGFMPARSTVELLPTRKGVNPVRETFIWTVEN